jgi:hypothetical protein
MNSVNLKNNIISWINTKYHKNLTVYDYCLDIYNIICNACSEKDYTFNIEDSEFIGKLISILYQSYPVA